VEFLCKLITSIIL